MKGHSAVVQSILGNQDFIQTFCLYLFIIGYHPVLYNIFQIAVTYLLFKFGYIKFDVGKNPVHCNIRYNLLYDLYNLIYNNWSRLSCLDQLTTITSPSTRHGNLKSGPVDGPSFSRYARGPSKAARWPDCGRLLQLLHPDWKYSQGPLAQLLT